nr:immunoglobulin light chain junction region [Macaca mulatta]
CQVWERSSKWVF